MTDTDTHTVAFVTSGEPGYAEGAVTMKVWNKADPTKQISTTSGHAYGDRVVWGRLSFKADNPDDIMVLRLSFPAVTHWAGLGGVLFD
ncbi:MAG: hypothetical protein BWY76_03034 [bacterium ADurb.Bin429]|nr:MAG: hypothetical protein BWY76_03034 [bacterium ADurb.Bin429]